MPGGSGALGFGGGLARGLANGLMRNQQLKREQAEKDEARKQREFSLIEPVLMRDALETGDFTSYVAALSQYNPDLAKQFKKENPFDLLAPILSGDKNGQAVPLGGGPQQHDPTTGPDYLSGQTGQPEPGQPQPSAQTSAAQQSARWTFGGAPLMSNADREARSVEAKVMLARRMLPILQQADPTATMDDAMAAVGIRTPSAAARSANSPAAQFADFVARTESGLGRKLTATELAAKRKEWESLNDSPNRSMGIYAERAARELGYASAEAAATAGKMADVNRRASEIAAEQAGATTTARGAAAATAPLTTKQKFDALADLQTAWRKAEAPQKEMKRQYGLMQTGLKRFNEGDTIGGSQAVLVTFQKILDPESVVRESEYARSSTGLGLMDRLEGYRDRYIGSVNPTTGEWVAGGAGIPPDELAKMVETARQFLEGQEDWNAIERERITSTATDFGLNPDRVFGTPAAPGTEKPAPAAPAPAAKPGATAAPAPVARPSTGGTGLFMDAQGNFRSGSKTGPIVIPAN